MDSIAIEEKLLIEMFASMRQLELSLHRVLYGCWDELCSFLDEDKVKIFDGLAEKLQKILDEEYLRIAVEQPTDLSLLQSIKAHFIFYVTRKSYVPKGEIKYAVETIGRVLELLDSQNPPDNEVLIELRQALYSSCLIVEQRVPSRVLRLARSVDHYFSPDFQSHRDLRDFVS